MQHFTRETCTGEKSFEQARISTYHFYMQHIRAAINFLDLALERGRQSTRSSPESLFAKSFQKTDPDQPAFLLKHEGAEGRSGRLKDRIRHGTGDKDEKSVNGTQIFHWEVSTGKTRLPFQEFRLFQKISSGTNQKVMFHLHPNRNLRNFLVNGKRSQSHDSKLPFYILTLFLRNQCIAITLTDRPRIEVKF